MRATVANKDSDIEDLENMLKDTCLENAQLKQALQQVQNEVKQVSDFSDFLPNYFIVLIRLYSFCKNKNLEVK